MNDYSYSDIEKGMKESFEAVLDPGMLDMFREITGDINPLHNDREYAKSRGYTDRVAFGMLTASFMSTLAGVYLPGKKSLIQSVESKFLRPVTAGEKLTVTGEVMDKNDTVKRIELRVTMTNKEGEKVLKGKMQVLIDE